MSTIMLAAAAAAGAGTPRPVAVTAETDGVRAELMLHRAEGDRRLRIDLNLRDAVSGDPLVRAQPLAWLTPRRGDEPIDCRAAIRKAAHETIASDAISLNGVRVVAAYEDGTIGIIDPQSGIGGTQLEAAVDLRARADMMAVDPSGLMVAVASNGAPQLFLVGLTATDHSTQSVALPDDFRPRALLWSTDGARLWVASTSGLVRVDIANAQVATVARWPTDASPVLSAGRDGRALLVGGGPLAFVIDEASGAINSVAGVGGIISAAFSSAARRWYLLDRQGALFALDGIHARPVESAAASTIGFEPGGRFALLLSSTGDMVTLFDSSVDKIVDSQPLPVSANRILFSGSFAYLHSAKSATVSLVPLELVDNDSKLSLVDIPFGSADAPPGPGMFQRIGFLPGGTAIVAANDARTLQVYSEGNMGSAGSLPNGGRALRGIAIVDRSLREIIPGRYHTEATVRYGGRYIVPIHSENPRLDLCPEVTIAGPRRQAGPSTPLALHVSPTILYAGMNTPIQVRVPGGASAPATLSLLATDTLGSWQQRIALRQVEPAVYAATIRFPRSGVFRLISGGASADVDVAPTRDKVN